MEIKLCPKLKIKWQKDEKMIFIENWSSKMIKYHLHKIFPHYVIFVKNTDRGNSGSTSMPITGTNTEPDSIISDSRESNWKIATSGTTTNTNQIFFSYLPYRPNILYNSPAFTIFTCHGQQVQYEDPVVYHRCIENRECFKFSASEKHFGRKQNKIFF